MASQEAGWVIHYWPKLGGRAEFLRLIFEAVGVSYQENSDHCMEYFRKGTCRFGEAGMFPSYAPPLLQKGDFYLSATPVICRYLGKKLGLFPDTEEDQLRTEQVNSAIHDFLAEGCNAFHGIDPCGAYLAQERETQPYIDRFVSERLPSWLKHFEAVLRANNGGNGFVFGEKMTYVDLGLFHVLRAAANQFPEAWKAASADYAKLLSAFKDRMSETPKLAAYFTSKRCRPFEGDSMM